MDGWKGIEGRRETLRWRRERNGEIVDEKLEEESDKWREGMKE